MKFSPGDIVMWRTHYLPFNGISRRFYSATVIKECKDGRILIRLAQQPYPSSQWYRQVKPENLQIIEEDHQ